MDKIQEIKREIMDIMVMEGKEISDICNDLNMNWNTLNNFLRKDKKVRMDTLSRLWKYIQERKK